MSDVRGIAPLGDVRGERVGDLAAAARTATTSFGSGSIPALKLACGRLPEDLCSQPTISRWENAPSLRELISGAGIMPKWSWISIIQSMLWRGTNHLINVQTALSQKADYRVTMEFNPLTAVPQSRRAPGAPPITPAKSGYSPHPKRIRVRTRFKHLATHGSPTVRIGTKQTFVAIRRWQISPTEPWIGLLRRSHPSFRWRTGG